MKRFETKQILAAYEHAEGGGQALHVMNAQLAIGGRKGVPSCFHKSKLVAHLIDYDRDRLEKTARRLGVRVIKVERAGGRGQHIDLCGGPLQRALQECTGE